MIFRNKNFNIFIMLISIGTFFKFVSGWCSYLFLKDGVLGSLLVLYVETIGRIPIGSMISEHIIPVNPDLIMRIMINGYVYLIQFLISWISDNCIFHINKITKTSVEECLPFFLDEYEHRYDKMNEFNSLIISLMFSTLLS